MKTNKGILSDEELKERTRFWNKKQFQVWSKKEMERSSKAVQKILVAIKDLTIEEVKEQYLYGSTLRSASWGDIEYAISIAPKTFRVKQG